MRKPVPPALYKTIDPLIREDLRRLSRMGQEILDWIDAEAGDGSVTSIGSSDSSLTVTNPSGPAVDLVVDPAHVTLTGQASGAANATKVTGITESSGPTALAIGAIADGQYLKRSGASIIGATIVAASGNPYIDPPTTPNAFNDEFASGSPDLAVRGYTVRSGATATTLTRSGNIDPWNATGPVGNTYWSTIIGSWLFIQAAPGIQVTFFKTITLAAGDTYFARLGGSTIMAPGASGRFNEIGLYANAAGGVDNANRVYSTKLETNTAASYIQYDVFRMTGGASSGNSRNGYGNYDIRGVRFDSGTTHTVFGVSSSGGQVLSQTLTGAPAAANLVYFGIRNSFDAGAGVPNIMGIDFIRKTSSNLWIAQP